MFVPRFRSLLGAPKAAAVRLVLVTLLATPAGAATGGVAASAHPAAPESPSAAGASPRAEGRSNIVRPGTILRAGDRRISSDGKYRLRMRRDGNLTLVHTKTRSVVWATDTEGRRARAAMQTDGNLVVYSRRGKVLWASGTHAPRARLAVQTDGNLVIYKRSRAVWSRFLEHQVVWPGHRLRPGVRVVSASGTYRLVMQTDGNLVLYGPGSTVRWAVTTGTPGTTARMNLTGQLEVEGPTGAVVWTSGSPASPEARLHVQDDGNLVIVSKDGQPLWATGTSTG